MQPNAKLKIAIIVEKNGKIFLQKEKYLKGSDHFWNVITGSFELSDQSLEDAAKRECMEEARMDVEIEGLVGTLITKRENFYKIYFIFLAKQLDGQGLAPEAEQKTRLENIIEQRWFTGEEIMLIDDNQFVTNSVAKIIKDYVANPSIQKAGYIELPEEFPS